MEKLQQLWELITEPPATDQDDARQQYLTRVILVMMGATSAVLTCVVVVGWAFGLFPLESVVRILLIDVPLGAAAWLVIRGHWRQAGIILPTVLLLHGVYGTLSLGLGTQLMFYVLAILVTGMLQDTRVQWLMAALCLVIYLTTGWFHGDRSLEQLATASTAASGYFAGVALLQWLSTTLLRHALAQSRAYAAELKEYRYHLQDLVEERSAELLRANERLQREIAEHKQTEAELEQKAHDLARSHAFIAALNHVTTRIESTRDPDQVLMTLGDELRALGLTCAVALWEPDDRVLAMRYTSLESPGLALAEDLAGIRLEGYRLPRGTWLVEELVESRRAVYVTDLVGQATALFPRLPTKVVKSAARLAGVVPDTSAVLLPLTVEELVVGAIVVWGVDLREDDVAALSIFAGQVASSLENARLFQAERRRTVELSTLLEATRAVSSTLELEETLALIAKQVVEAVGVDGCTLSRWDREADAVVTWIDWRRDLADIEPPGTIYALDDFPATRAVLETRQAAMITVSDPEADPAEVAHMRKVETASLLMLPLIAGGRVIGLLELDESKRERHFTAAEIRLCQALVDQAAVAIENSRLYESVLRELAERRRVENALRKARDELERRVEERTAELSEANAALRAEIAERERAEEALRENEERYRNLFHHSNDGIFLHDLEGNILDVNHRALEQMGYTRPEILALRISDLHPPEALDASGQAFQTVSQQGFVSFEIYFRKKNGRVFLAEVSSSLFEIGGQKVVQGVVRDITERKRAEQLLQALNQASLAMEKALTSEEIFAAVAEELRELGFACAVLLADEDQSTLTLEYLTSEPRMLRATERLLGFRFAGFSFSIESADVFREVVWSRKTVFIDGEGIMQQILPGPAKRFASRLVKMLGMAKAIAAPLIVENMVTGVLSVHSAELLESDLPAITAFAHQVAAAWRKAQLIQDLENSLAELKRTQAELIQAQKMEAIGRLAGGVAHDFNNLLTVIQISTQLLMRQLRPEDPLRERAQQIHEAGERASVLTRQLLRFSRREIIEPRVVYLSQVVRNLGRMLQRVIGEDVALALALADDLWPVKVDPSQIEQVIINLAVNARDAMPQGGHLSIETANVTLDGVSAAQFVGAQPGEYVMLAVSDTGVGMDDEVKAHLFEPFFTTKERGQGTGLGLSTVYGIVRQNGGHIGVDSELGQGTTFRIYLPRTEETRMPIRAPSRDVSPRAIHGSETILMVEDEGAVRQLATHILKGHGYQVLCAGNGAEALRLSREHQGAIDLLVTDVVMPGMNGEQLARRLQSERPGLRVLFMSGYSDELMARYRVLDEDSAFLAKPFTLEALARKVRAVLDAPE